MTIGFIPVMIITSVMAEKGWLGFLGFCPPTQVTLSHSYNLKLLHSQTLTISLFTLSHAHTLTLLHSYNIKLTQSHVLTFSHSCTLTLSYSYNLKLSQSFTPQSHSLTLSNAHTLTLSHSYNLKISHSNTLLYSTGILYPGTWFWYIVTQFFA